MKISVKLALIPMAFSLMNNGKTGADIPDKC